MVGIEKHTVTICCQFQIYPGSVGVYQERSLHEFGKEKIIVVALRLWEKVDLPRKSHSNLDKAFGFATGSCLCSRDLQDQRRRVQFWTNPCRRN